MDDLYDVGITMSFLQAHPWPSFHVTFSSWYYCDARPTLNPEVLDQGSWFLRGRATRRTVKDPKYGMEQ